LAERDEEGKGTTHVLLDLVGAEVKHVAVQAHLWSSCGSQQGTEQSEQRLVTEVPQFWVDRTAISADGWWHPLTTQGLGHNKAQQEQQQSLGHGATNDSTLSKRTFQKLHVLVLVRHEHVAQQLAHEAQDLRNMMKDIHGLSCVPRPGVNESRQHCRRQSSNRMLAGWTKTARLELANGAAATRDATAQACRQTARNRTRRRYRRAGLRTYAAFELERAEQQRNLSREDTQSVRRISQGAASRTDAGGQLAASHRAARDQQRGSPAVAREDGSCTCCSMVKKRSPGPVVIRWPSAQHDNGQKVQTKPQPVNKPPTGLAARGDEGAVQEQEAYTRSQRTDGMMK
jgi:hypothetical protein